MAVKGTSFYFDYSGPSDGCKGRESLREIIDDYYCDRKDYVNECCSRSVCKEKYIESSLAIIEKYLGELSFRDVNHIKNTLSFIYCSLGSDSKSLALFTSSAFHNTSFLTIFKASSPERYCSRGLLMIYGVDNYKLLNSFSRGSDFVNCPDEVSNQSKNVVNATVCFFKYIMEGKQYNFVNMIGALNPDEYRIYIESGCVKKDARWRNREKLYKMMMALY